MFRLRVLYTKGRIIPVAPARHARAGQRERGDQDDHRGRPRRAKRSPSMPTGGWNGVDLAATRSPVDKKLARAVLRLPGIEDPAALAQRHLGGDACPVGVAKAIDRAVAARCPLSDAQLARLLGDLPGLRRLAIQRANGVSDAGLDALASLRQLEVLALVEMDISGKALERLPRLERLRSLDLREVRDAGGRRLTAAAVPEITAGAEDLRPVGGRSGSGAIDDAGASNRSYWKTRPSRPPRSSGWRRAGWPRAAVAGAGAMLWCHRRHPASRGSHAAARVALDSQMPGDGRVSPPLGQRAGGKTPQTPHAGSQSLRAIEQQAVRPPRCRGLAQSLRRLDLYARDAFAAR